MMNKKLKNFFLLFPFIRNGYERKRSWEEAVNRNKELESDIAGLEGALEEKTRHWEEAVNRNKELETELVFFQRNNSRIECPCCYNFRTEFYQFINGYNYYKCHGCGSLFIAPEWILQIDQGNSLVDYQGDYWKFEIESSRKRSFGSNMARLSEVIHYAKRNIEVFLDIGSGPGFVLDAVKYFIPSSADKFYAVEKYPPPIDNLNSTRTKCKNYYIGEIYDFPRKVDAGMCIEVIEHLTPTMFKNLLSSIAKISNDGAVYIFNTGMPEYVINEDPHYLDPVKRGHIMSYSLEAVKFIAKDIGFNV
jgi:SAM-dependent methyltransferase